RDLIFRLRQEAGALISENPKRARHLLTGMVERELNCSGPIQIVAQQQKVVALVGPTGVGKTTTIAKLAANFRLRDGIKMGLVTVDTYRIAAVEQLRTYAEIIDLPMKVVTNSQEMQQAMEELSDMDLVLIDTAGRSPKDELKIKELKQLLAAANVDEVHLVMSLTASVKSLLSTARNFATADVTSLILTKLDEADSLGAVLSLNRELDLPVSYLTTGQNVPDDIEPALYDRLARRILGRDILH
ncbi:50S ribosome-binding GTPase, partial [Planctomycetaceae bacterium]|nr:50S ribosome-binding GTPase [Planctomycetaceae bacterium]